MKRFFLYLTLVCTAACTSFGRDPYGDTVRTLRVTLRYPEGFGEYLREGVAVALSDLSTGNRYTAGTDAGGSATLRVGAGIYRLTVQDRPDDEAVFNGTVQQLDLTREDVSLEVALAYSKPGTVIIKELYTSGCPQDAPSTGSYYYDKYVILHNNSFDVQYLDGLCLGMVAPYNSTAQNNPWTSTDPTGNLVFRDYAAVPDALWTFPGSGREFPLEPGADAVVALNGAVDHTQTYSLSVDLNREGYFVLFDELLYPDERSHPVPGDRIAASHRLQVLKKTGTATTKVYVVSNNSPAMILFRAPEEFDLGAYLADDAQSTVLNGSIVYSKIPWEWVVDGVEVVDATSKTRIKRLHPDVDAGAAEFTVHAQGHTIHRVLDEAGTAAAGFERYLDTGNSSTDFYERETQSLRDL